MTEVERELLAIALYESWARGEILYAPSNWYDLSYNERNKWRNKVVYLYTKDLNLRLSGYEEYYDGLKGYFECS